MGSYSQEMKSSTLIFVVALLVFASVPHLATAQTPSRQTMIHSGSPFEIARAVNRSNGIWRHQRIDVPVDLAETWKQLGIDGPACGSDCEAKVFRLDLDKQPGSEVLLKLTRSYDFCRYLIFKFRGRNLPRTRRWKLLGYIDHDFNRYRMAEQRVVRAFGKNWLVIRGQEGSGSGYYLYGDTWFEVNKKGVRPVLHYSVDGLTDAGIGGLNWKLSSRAIAVKGTRKQSIRVSFVVFYTAQGFEDVDFTRRFVNRRQAYYVWNKRSREFVFTKRGSTISEYEMNLVANVETEPSSENGGVKIGGNTFFSGLRGFVGSGYEMFLRLNAARLMNIAQGRNEQSKAWLSKFLTQCEDIPEKLAIERVLLKKL